MVADFDGNGIPDVAAAGTQPAWLYSRMPGPAGWSGHPPRPRCSVIQSVDSTANATADVIGWSGSDFAYSPGGSGATTILSRQLMR
jgi:hypothetical protein